MVVLRRMTLLTAQLLSVAYFASAQIMSVDLGHEFFKVALMRQGAPLEVVLNGHSKRKTPTAVSFFDSSRTFGDDALAHQGKAPSKVPMFFHSFMGKNFSSPADIEAGGKWWQAFGLGDRFYSFDLEYDEDRGVPAFRVGYENATYQEEVLASIFYYAKKLSEETADGKEVRDLVVTVPADASLRERQAIVAAGEIAGCRVLTLTHETSAFAVHRAVDFQPEKGKIDIGLFYNMGSRKTEVSVIKFDNRQAGMVAGKTAPVVTVLGTAVDYSVGGHLMDIKIADVMLKKFQEKHPKLADGIAKNARALRKLLAQAQKTKAVLSANKNAPFIVESLFDDVDFQTSISRETFQEMCADMFDKISGPIEQALAVANVTAEDITMVEVIGGAWRVPKIQELLSKYLEEKKGGKIPLGQHINGEEGGALGAALVGANGSTSFRAKKIFFSDITSHEYSAQVVSLTGEWEKNVTTMFPVGTSFGAKVKLQFNLEEDFAILLRENGILMAEYRSRGLAELIKGKWSEYNLTAVPKLSVSITLQNSGLVEVKVPTASVEESYWANVTVPKLKPNVSANASMDNTTETSANASNDTAEATDADNQKDDNGTQTANEDANATGNKTANVTAPETEIIQKLKKKKHDKKLTWNVTHFRPTPLTEQGILEAKARFQKLAEKEQNMAKITGLKNELEATLYSSREKLESDVIVSVSTEEQREAVLKLCTDSEEWMYEASDDLHEYERKLGDIQNVLGPIEERAAEAEARLDLPGSVKEMVQEIKSIQQQVVKNMSWVNESKTADAAAKLTEFEEWWVKKQEQQAALPSHEAPAYTKAAVMEKLEAVHKEWDKLKKIKKPKAPKVAKAPKSKDGAALPITVEATQTELAAVREKKVAAVEKEDFDAAHKLKNREKTLVDHLAKLQTDKPEKSEL